ncbi:MAG: sulfatase-like hydrolase/transferase [Saprospiraceae bacterium]|nr:sulfatase-like hydrolase/transferase [Saprospiraceae bacterium]
MKSAILFPLRLLLFWLLFFAVFRVWFVAWFYKEWPGEAPYTTWLSLWHALPLDISMAAYLMVIPVLIWFAGVIAGPSRQYYFSRAIRTVNLVLIGIMVLVCGANVFIYEEWHTLLNNRALAYLGTPRALLDSMSLLFQVISVGLYLSFLWLMWRVYRLVAGLTEYATQTSRSTLAIFPVHAGLLFLAIRGGLGVIPINESAVYFSSNLFTNHAATNPAWNLFHSLIETRSTENHFRVTDPKTAGDLVNCSLLQRCRPDADSIPGPRLSTAQPPNIVFLVLESHTAQVVEALGGEAGICPNLDRLAREGVLFENIYSSGYRTDQGLVSILAGFPAQPDQSIVLLSDKAEKLNSIPKILHQKGYSTAFFYGGELTFANIGVWLTTQHFEKIRSEKDFTRREKSQRWGVDDRYLLQHAAKEIGKLKAPFFATALTLSLHPPFDIPNTDTKNLRTDREKFLYSARFADEAIGEFFKTASEQEWYRNTVFVLVADHGSSNPNGIGLDNPVSRRIPLIFFGEPLPAELHGARISEIGNHHDIPATLLGMMGMDAPDMPWSRDLLKNKGESTGSQGFAYYTNESGLGWVMGQGKDFYAFGNGAWHRWEGQQDSVSHLQARAYLQVLYDDFLSK